MEPHGFAQGRPLPYEKKNLPCSATSIGRSSGPINTTDGVLEQKEPLYHHGEHSVPYEGQWFLEYPVKAFWRPEPRLQAVQRMALK